MYVSVNVHSYICTAAQIVKYKKTQSHIPEGKQKCGFESSC